MRKLLLCLGLAGLVAGAVPVAAQPSCEGTSGSATINAAAWMANCVVAASAPDCLDSLGTEYECFEIVGTSANANYQTVALFLTAPPVQGMTYGLGGTSGNGAMVIGGAGFFLTAEAPNTGQVQVTRFDSGAGIIECNFSFDAQNLFLPQSVSVTSGLFSGRLVRLTPATWSNFKLRYR